MRRFSALVRALLAVNFLPFIMKRWAQGRLNEKYVLALLFYTAGIASAPDYPALWPFAIITVLKAACPRILSPMQIQGQELPPSAKRQYTPTNPKP